MSILPDIPPYRRAQVGVLAERLSEPRRLIQVIVGPRQVGKTTMVRQVLSIVDEPVVSVSADEPALKDRAWLAAQWERARVHARKEGSCILVVDEIQKVTGWPETVKRLWDEDTSAGTSVKTVLLGSTPVLLVHGVSESLAGRFETIHVLHWSYDEMASAFNVEFDEFVYFGGYPGAAWLIHDEPRWRAYVLDSLVETAISRDILLLQRIEKPALLRRLFSLGCEHSGSVVSYNKMLGQLQDVGNTVTLAHYLDLLSGAGLLSGLQKYSTQPVRRRGSSPKLQVHNNALLSAMADARFDDVRGDPEIWGHWVESAVGAHLVNAAAAGTVKLYWWRDGNEEVDFVIAKGKRVVAIEVKSGRRAGRLSGLDAFTKRVPGARPLLVGGDGIPVAEFLRLPVESWLEA
ncbi:predicted ATPase [Coriobacteriaceae bacterium EMTCatB1]|nr:predicted ATPase [Coriobacteriaceae bacterium EMTCatB1]